MQTVVESKSFSESKAQKAMLANSKRLLQTRVHPAVFSSIRRVELAAELFCESCGHVKSDLDHFEGNSSRRLEPMTLPPSRIEGSEKAKSHSAKVDLLYRDHWTALVSSLRRTFGDGPPDPDDVAQQAFQKLIEREQLSDIRSLKGFLWRTARNLMINAKRSRATRSRYDFEIEHLYFPNRGVNSTPEAVLSANEELRAINDVLRSMPEKRRRAFILHRVEGLSVSEVARRLRLSRSPTDRHIRRAAEDIQMCLSNLRHEDAE